MPEVKVAVNVDQLKTEYLVMALVALFLVIMLGVALGVMVGKRF